MPKLSINEMTTYRWSFLDDVTAYHELGVDGIGVWRRKISDFGEERGVELLRETALPVSNLLWAGGFTGADGRSFKQSVEDGLDAVRLAAELGTDTLVVLTGSRGGHTHNHARSLVVDALKELAAVAAESGVSLALEPITPALACQSSFLCTLDDTRELLDRAGSLPQLGLAFDTFHLWQEDDLLDRIPEIVPLVKIVHLGDWREAPHSESDRARLGEGVIPLKEIVGALDASGYRGYYDVEIPADGLRDADYRSLLQECRAAFEKLWQ
jgi:sugar phosphate isomerase/epimerase